MGALTSKKTQFNYRPWENKAIDSADSLDSFGTPIQLNIRNNTVMRVLPRLSINKQTSWISDRTRFSFDGLERQRIQTPVWRKHYRAYSHTSDYSMKYIKNTRKTSLFTVSWNFAFDLIKRHYSDSSTAVLGPTVDFTSTAMVSSIFNNVAADNGVSRIPKPSIRYLTPFGGDDDGFDPSAFSVEIAKFLLGLQKEWNPTMPRRVGYILLNLGIRKFPLLELLIQQLASMPGFEQNTFYTFSNNFSTWEPFTEHLGLITELPKYIQGKTKNVLQLQDFETVVFLNGRWGEATDFISGDDLASLLLDNKWGIRHKHIYVFDLPHNRREYGLHYLAIRNSFYPRWQSGDINFDEFLYMHEAPHVATAAYEHAIQDAEDTLRFDVHEKEGPNPVYVLNDYPNWREAPGVSLKHLASNQTAHHRFTNKTYYSTTLRSLSSFQVSYGTNRSEKESGNNLELPARGPLETSTNFGIDCFGRVARIAFRYPGPLYSKDSIDMFTELAQVLQRPLSLYTPSPLSFSRVSSSIPFFVETPTNLAFPNMISTYIYDEYRIDAITKASPMMALCSQRFYPQEINFNSNFIN